VTQGDVTVQFEARGAVREAFLSTDSEICLSGAAGTGKSVGALMLTHLTMLQYPGARALIVRKTLTSLTSSTLVTFRRVVAKEALEAGILHFYGGSAQEPASFRYSNGSVIVVGGMDRASRLLSTDFDLCFADECVEMTSEDLDVIVTRLRHGVVPTNRLICATNPGAPTHHVALRCASGRMRMLYSKHEDNPRLYQNGEWTDYGKSYLAKLESLVGVRYERLRWGRWLASEGQVYESFDPAVHVVEPFKVPDHWGPYYVSLDFGYVAPMVAQIWVQDPDGALYLIREHYHTKVLVEDLARTLLKDLKSPDGSWKIRPRAIICDHDAEDRATLERHLGMSTVAATKTVSDGIQAVQSRLAPAGNGKPRLFLFRGATARRDPDLEDAKKPTSTEQEFGGYVWEEVKDGKPVKDAPVKVDDHGCLAAGTLVTTSTGPVPIEDIRPGTLVATRDGWRPVVAAGMTNPAADVVTVHLDNGTTVTATPDHPFWVSDTGWQRCDSMGYGDILGSWNPTSSPSTGSATAATPTPPTNATGSTTRPGSGTSRRATSTSTSRSGSTSTDGPSLTVARSTTGTSIPSTTTTTTWSASRLRSTRKRTGSRTGRVAAALRCWSTWSASAPWPPRGIRRLRAWSGTARTPATTGSAEAQCWTTPASSAVSRSPHATRLGTPGSAPTTASRPGAARPGWMTSTVTVPPAGARSGSTATRTSSAAPVRVVRISAVPGRQPVYNLTVAGSPEFYANGVLVHNCDALRYMVAELDLGARPRVRFI
jgi:phage terminase large subunit